MATVLPSTHKAIFQSEYAKPLSYKEVPVPTATPGSAVVKILAAPIVSYSKSVYDGTRKYSYPVPLVPGSSGIGRIVAIGSDATLLQLNELVYIDGFIRSRDNPSDRIILALSDGGSAGAKKLAADVWRDGTWAEYVRVPLENAYVLNDGLLLRELGYDVYDLATIGKYIIPYGGLKTLGLESGEMIVIAPATGAFGGAAVMVAVGLGLQVIAMGRNEEALKKLEGSFERGKVKTVKISGDAMVDTEEIKRVAGGREVDAGFDVGPPSAADSTHIRSIIAALRHKGRFALMGGYLGDIVLPFRQLMRKDLSLRFKWMYEREDIVPVLRLIEAGNLKIGKRAGVTIDSDFTFEEFEKALDVAEEKAGWNSDTVMRPVRI